MIDKLQALSEKNERIKKRMELQANLLTLSLLGNFFWFMQFWTGVIF